MGTKYLYSKIMSATHNKVKLVAGKEELSFLKKHNIGCTFDTDGYLIISREEFLKNVA